MSNNVSSNKSNRNKSTKHKFIGGKFVYAGFFLLSFQIMEEEKVRIHWFFGGGGTRFWPELMAELWPICFESNEEMNQELMVDRSENENESESADDVREYSAQFMKEQFALNVKDEQFDAWYDVLVP